MFSLRMLLAVVAISAVYIAGMAYPTEWWETSLVTLTYVIYAGAITAAIAARQSRTFFVAFAVFGLAYGAMLHFGLGWRMVTERVLDSHVERVGQAMIDAADQGQLVEMGDFGWWQARFKFIGRLSVAVLISLVAGVVAEALARRSNKAHAPSVGKL